jgi:hypothetical protein
VRARLAPEEVLDALAFSNRTEVHRASVPQPRHVESM